MQGVNPHMVQFLDLRIRRGHVLEDAIGQVLLLCQQMFSGRILPLCVHRWMLLLCCRCCRGAMS